MDGVKKWQISLQSVHQLADYSRSPWHTEKTNNLCRSYQQLYPRLSGLFPVVRFSVRFLGQHLPQSVSLFYVLTVKKLTPPPYRVAAAERVITRLGFFLSLHPKVQSCGEIKHFNVITSLKDSLKGVRSVWGHTRFPAGCSLMKPVKTITS